MILLALHGILTGRSDVTWPERLQAFAFKRDRDMVVLTDQYDAGPFPRLNWFVGNPRMARAMALRISTWLEDSNHEAVALVGHSNGCDIVRRVAIELAEKGVVVQCLIMVAPPIAPSLKANGLKSCIDAGKIRRVVCYYTPRDTVLAPARTLNPLTWLGGFLRWPYGNMGRVGIPDVPTVEADALAPNAAVFNRVFPTYWHTTYFNRATSPATFNLILNDAHLD